MAPTPSEFKVSWGVLHENQQRGVLGALRGKYRVTGEPMGDAFDWYRGGGKS